MSDIIEHVEHRPYCMSDIIEHVEHRLSVCLTSLNMPNIALLYV